MLLQALLRYSWLIVLMVGLPIALSLYRTIDQHQQQQLATEINYRSQIKRQGIALHLQHQLKALDLLAALLQSRAATPSAATDNLRHSLTRLARQTLQRFPHALTALQLRRGDVAVRIGAGGNALPLINSAKQRTSPLLRVISSPQGHTLRYIHVSNHTSLIADLDTTYLVEQGIDTGHAAGLDVDLFALQQGKPILLHHHASRSRSDDPTNTNISTQRPPDWIAQFDLHRTTLLLEIRVAPALLKRYLTNAPLIWFAGAIIISILIALLLYYRTRFSQQLQRMVTLRTAQLQASRQKLAAVVDHAVEAILMIDDTGKILLANPAASSLFGYNAEQWQNITIADLVPEELRDQHGQWLRSEVDGERHDVIGQVREIEILHQDGSRIPCEISVNDFQVDKQRRFSVVLRDIRAAKAAAQAEAQQRQKQQSINTMLAGALQADDLPAALNSALRTILSIDTLALEARGAIFLIDEESINNDRLRMVAQQHMPEEICRRCQHVSFGECLCGTAAERNEIIVKQHLDAAHTITLPGMVDHGHICAPIRAGERLLGVLNLYTNAEIAHSEHDLAFIETACHAIALIIEKGLTAEKHAQMRTIIETSPDFIGIGDSNGYVRYINPAGRRMLSLTPDEPLRHRQISEFHSSEEMARIQQEVFPAIASAGGQHTTEITFIDAHGEAILTLASFSAQLDEQGQPRNFAVIARDIRRERAQQQQAEHAQRLESLGVLAGGIAHDFNNILAAIMGNAAMAQRHVENLREAAPQRPDNHLPDKLRKQLGNIIDSSEQAAALCQQMLAYSGQSNHIIEPVNLNAIVQESTKLLEISVSPGVLLHFDLQEPLADVHADPSQMRQMLLNMVINAAEAIGEQSGHIEICTDLIDADQTLLAQSVVHEQVEAGRYVRLTIRDDGCGMDATVRERIFEPFFTTKFTGRGLGMSAILGIVRSHHGAMLLESEPGQGTTFQILLPALTPSAAQSQDSLNSALDTPTSGTVLIIDDDENVREMAMVILEDAGYSVLTADNGLEGVERYRQALAEGQQIDVVLMDMTMPKLNGAACCRELRKLDASVKVVISSGYAERDIIHRFEANEAPTSFLQKPYQPDTLLQKVAQVIRA